MKLNFSDVHRVSPEVIHRVYGKIHRKITDKINPDVSHDVYLRIFLRASPSHTLIIASTFY